MMDWIRRRCASCASIMLKCVRIFWNAMMKYIDTDGEQRAASFAYYAFFALFPLILLFVSIGSIFVDKSQVATLVIRSVGSYIPMGDEGEYAVIKTINGVVKSWKAAGIIAIVAIVWSALGLFHALVRGVNRAWGTLEYPWYRLPVKNLAMIGIVGSALLIGILTPAIVQAVEAFTWKQAIPEAGIAPISMIFYYSRRLVPTLVLFYALAMFYKFAPRRRTSFAEIWFAALLVTILLQLLQAAFVIFAKNYYNFNRLYGAFGGVVAFLMWIYLSGSVIIFGGCLSASQAEATGPQTEDERAD